YKSLLILCGNFNYGPYCRVIVPCVKYLSSLLAIWFVLVGMRIKMNLGSSLLTFLLVLTGLYVYSTLMFGAHLMSSFWTMSQQFKESVIRRCAEQTSSSRDDLELRKYAR